MPKNVKPGDPLMAATINALQDEVRRLGNVRVAGMSMHNGSGGLTYGVVFPPTGPIKAIVATGGLSARVSGTQLGVGNAVLWPRTAGAATPAAGATVTVYNPYNVAIPAAHTVVVMPDDAGGYLLVGSDCVEA